MANHEGLIGDLLEKWAVATPNAVAIASPSRVPLTYGALFRQIQEIKGFLQGSGLGRGDRIAIVSPDSPELAVAVLAVTNCASVAPLNSRYQRSEFEFYLSDIGAKALIVPSGFETPAIAVAQERGLRVIRLSRVPSAPAGIFTLASDSPSELKRNESLSLDDVALVLHTSGTTGRPKLIPLTQSNLCISAKNIAASLQLSSADRVLNVMPLFHVHGLIGGLLSTMAAGGSAVCTTGFQAAHFFEWLQEFQPTWFTAVPAMHQALLARLQAENPPIGKSSALKFIRSCSSALPPVVMEQLEKAFGVPVVEAYGMTEASHQIAVNPLPPEARKPGSVGRPTGPEVRIVDEAGQEVTGGSAGEVIIRGASVVQRNKDAMGSAQLVDENGWYRTGDLGLIDSDGYLFLHGRIREMINRGGEKIAPREVEDIILNHPAVKEAAVFALPDANLGQVVAVAVVLRPNAQAGTRDIQEFVASHLADFKVPRRVVFLEEIPKAATGKVQRTGLAKKLGLLDDEAPKTEKSAAQAEPNTATEKLLAEIWRQVLKLQSVGINDNFFLDLGGDSLLATEMALQVEKTTGVQLSGSSIMLKPTIATLAAWLESPASSSLIVPLKPQGTGTPLFCMHGLSGDPCEFFPLAAQLAPDRPAYGLRSPAAASQATRITLEEMAQRHLGEILSVQPNGPYLLCGHSSGGTIALEVAQQLQAQGQSVALIAVFDGLYPGYLRSLASRSVRQRLPMHLRRLLNLKLKDALPYIRDRIGTVKNRIEVRLWRRKYRALAASGSKIPDSMVDVKEAHRQMIDAYKPRPYAGRVEVFRSEARRVEEDLDWDLGWSNGVMGEVIVHETPGDHGSMLKKPAVSILGEQLEVSFARAFGVSAPQPGTAVAQPDRRPTEAAVSA